MLKYGHQAWSSLAGEMYATTVEVGRRPSSPPRRFCCECSKLRVTYYTKQFAHRDDPHFCTPCAIRLGYDPTREAFGLAERPQPQRRPRNPPRWT
jgi:hypothetical protein